MVWTCRTWILLALCFLISCTRADIDTTSATTIGKSSDPGATSAVDSSPTPLSSSSSSPADPLPPATEKQTTRAPPTDAAVTTNAQPTEKPSEKPTEPPTKAASPSAQPTTASAGGGAELQPSPTTGSRSATEMAKTTRPPGTTAPTSNAQSSPPPPVSVRATGSAVSPPLTSGSPPVQTSPPGSRTTVTVPQPSANIVTTTVSSVPAAAPTGNALSQTTARQDTRDVVDTTPGLPSKPSPSPDQRPSVASRSTLPPTVPQRLDSSSSTPTPPTATTAGGSRLDLVSVSTRKSRDQTTDQTTDYTTVQTTVPITTAVPAPRIFSYSLNKGHQSAEEKELVSLCQQLMGSLEDGNCTISFRHHNGKVLFDSAEITGKVKTTIVTQHFEDITKKPSDNRTLITILASCGALLIMIVILAVCASQHRKPYGNQMQLTEELQTVENGYHDNPTLEVMEVGVDMQEKKAPPPLNNGGGDFNDSWIVPIDNLLKEEGPEEEDTHL